MHLVNWYPNLAVNSKCLVVNTEQLENMQLSKRTGNADKDFSFSFSIDNSINEMMAKTESLQTPSKSVLHGPCRKLEQLYRTKINNQDEQKSHNRR